jgi:hypothetical protein
MAIFPKALLAIDRSEVRLFAATWAAGLIFFLVMLG